MSRTNVTLRPDECESASCGREPHYELAYTETSPHSYRWLCGECADMERIHDPIDTKIVTEPWEIEETDSA